MRAIAHMPDEHGDMVVMVIVHENDDMWNAVRAASIHPDHRSRSAMYVIEIEVIQKIDEI